jgi:hypothetical protein
MVGWFDWLMGFPPINSSIRSIHPPHFNQTQPQPLNPNPQPYYFRPAAVDEALGLLPLALKWGKVGTFHLSIPWNALGARPLVITLTDVTLVFKLLSPDEEGGVGGGGEEDDDGDGGGTGLEAEARRRRRAAKERAVQVREPPQQIGVV